MFDLRKVTFYVTNACNLRCKHCYASSGYPLDEELRMEEVRNLFNELYNLGVFELEFSGGEPFMRPDFTDILYLANSMDFSLEVLTNGMLIDKKKADTLKDLSVRVVQVPLEGLKEAHESMRGNGTFERAVNSIKLLKNAGLNVQVRTTITKKSLSDLEPLAGLLANMDVDAFLATEYIPIGRGLGMNDLMLGPEEKNELQKTLTLLRNTFGSKISIRGDAYGCFEGSDDISKFGKSNRSILCGALRGDWCGILPNGVVTPCDIIPFYAGSIRLQKMEDIWNFSHVLKSFRQFDPQDLKGSCGTCPSKVICGGCRALAFLFYGDLYEEDPMCWKAKNSVLRPRVEAEAGTE